MRRLSALAATVFSTILVGLFQSSCFAHSIEGITNLSPPPVASAQTSPDLPQVVEGVIDQFKLWQAGSTIRACFFGSSHEVQEKFVEATQEWLDHANLKIDFGSTDAYRDCASDPGNQLRIAFKPTGNWSYVGTDSIRVGLSQPSMNIANGNSMGEAVINPKSFRSTVLHEVGHFLALQHEHQSPEANCDSEFDWPIIYSEFMSRYGWDQAKVDNNLRSLVKTRRLRTTPYDTSSIMHYYFEPWMYADGENSKCYVGHNNDPSGVDLLTMEAAYPSSPSEQLNLVNKRLESTRDLLKDNTVSAEEKKLLVEAVKAEVDRFPGANVDVIITGNKSPVVKDVNTGGGDFNLEIK
ncbi:hypothetical protein HFO24_06705 [Rhizobium laguerreae]|uniref:M12 family metallopeptidase n=1 Tax=Rhizobium laguerreae TaxID=1076926 RepID=UPI001C91ADFE|nr:M12 family metallopeptidase [Rhizobium laguerreae]MBY3181360.1 hypothetical protein [Rhizobium laguerreae]